jgi:hypothetical protein
MKMKMKNKIELNNNNNCYFHCPSILLPTVDLITKHTSWHYHCGMELTPLMKTIVMWSF